MKKKRDINEVLAEMYADEKGTLLNLFFFNLISSDVLIDKEACVTRLEKLAKFEAFLDQQEVSKKKSYYQKIAGDGRQIIERELEKFMVPMKLIFLDVDGVLNASFTKETLYGFVFVVDSKLELLKQLIDQTEAKVVLSSTWRQGWKDLDEGLDTIDSKFFVGLRDKLLEHGIELLDYTPITDGGMNRRGEEIDMWLKDWKGEPIESMVILDDLNGRYLRPYAGRLVRTSIAQGLLQKHVDLAVKILEKPLNNSKPEAPAEPPTMVHYSWSEDGEIELCEQLEDILTEDTVCDYCDNHIKAGEKAVLLFSVEDGDEYTIHPECAKKACSPA